MNTKLLKISDSEKNKLYHKIFSIKNDDDFNSVSLDLFRLHYSYNDVYNRYCNLLDINPDKVDDYLKIPCLHVDTFRKQTVCVNGLDYIDYFESSGTSGSIQGKHFIHDFSLYETSFIHGFTQFYGSPDNFAIMALLPAYLERPHSSLVYMASKLIEMSKNELSAFYLYNLDELYENLLAAKKKNQPVILLGVSFALLDFSEKFKLDFPDLILMETGGMKGKRKEITREELHSRLKSTFNISHIHSEYGMSEMFSQAYSKGDGIFYSPNWLKIKLRDAANPFEYSDRKGLINIFDLANVWSCPFLSTDDIGVYEKDNGFSVLGRSDFSFIRGCNTMFEDK